MDLLTIAQEERLKAAVIRQIEYDRHQAACILDELWDQANNTILPHDFREVHTRRVIRARRRWFEDALLDWDSYELLDLMRLSCRIYSWGGQLSQLYTNTVRIIRERTSRIRELNFQRRQLQWAL
ncbi:hypothetical protein CAEBREN_05938 [Caenorhabditis brenneri]|uniref:Uncharacterized protein n=1 Tax=Caenorhabditis brenneri TaxID=135651 RepID=G0M8N1_CAEBE|nr:hypothetical protein CAEBREN_05938 [Caenorhabditis brenneri]